MSLHLRLLLFAAIGSISCATARSGGSASTTGWLELTSEHFVLRTSLDESAAHELVSSLERYRQAMLIALEVELPHSTRLDVYAFSERRDLEELGWDEGVAGFMRLDPALLAMRPTSKYKTAPLGAVQAHELAHYFMHFVFRRQPLWFAEGMADYLGAIHISTEGDEAIIGRANMMRLGSARFPMTLEELWGWEKWKGSSDAIQNERAYASSWLWVHFLLNAHSTRFVEFMGALAEGSEPRAAFAQAFKGIPSVQLEEGVIGYRRATQQYEVFRHRLKPVGTAVTTRVMTAEDKLWARYMVSISKTVDRQLLQEAEAKFPGSVEALLLQLEVSSGNEVPPELYASLKVKHRTDSRVAVALAERWARLPAADADALTLSALELAPTHPRALRSRLQYLNSTHRSAEALPLIETVLTAAPYCFSCLVAVTSTLAKGHRCADAVTMRERSLSLLPESVSLDERQKLIAPLTKLVVDCRPGPAP